MIKVALFKHPTTSLKKKLHIEEQFQVVKQEAKRAIHCAILWRIRVYIEFHC